MSVSPSLIDAMSHLNIVAEKPQLGDIVNGKVLKTQETSSSTLIDAMSHLNLDNNFEAPEEKAFDATPDSGIHELVITDPEQRERLEDEWKKDLAKTDEEIATLKQVLAAKMKHSQDLKRKLGITPWKELKDDVEQSFRNIQETPALKEVGGKLVEWNSAITSAPIYQKSSDTLKTATEKTMTLFDTLGSTWAKRLGGIIKNTTKFRRFQMKLDPSILVNEKDKTGAPQSLSVYHMEYITEDIDRRGTVSAGTTPVIPEREPLP